jgi:geranylgeranyl pyrophosphate synthase
MVCFPSLHFSSTVCSLDNNSSSPPQARSLVLRSSGVHRTKLLAKSFAEKAKEVLEELPESVAKAGLVALTERVVGRRS